MGEPWMMLLMTSAGEAAAQAVVVMEGQEGNSDQECGGAARTQERERTGHARQPAREQHRVDGLRCHSVCMWRQSVLMPDFL